MNRPAMLNGNDPANAIVPCDQCGHTHPLAMPCQKRGARQKRAPRRLPKDSRGVARYHVAVAKGRA